MSLSRIRRLTVALILAIGSVLLLLLKAAGDLVQAPLLLPTALIASFIVPGGPEGSGRAGLWVAAFWVVTIATWTAVWYGLVSIAILAFNKIPSRK